MCGVAGIIAIDISSKEMIQLLLKMGFLLQHRGQGGAGMAYLLPQGQIEVYKKAGLEMNFLRDVFTQGVIKKIIEKEPKAALLHIRYPTQGRQLTKNAQPHIANWQREKRLALASNGDVPNMLEKRRSLEKKGVRFKSENDGEFLLKFIIFESLKHENNLFEGIVQVMDNLSATYSAALLSSDSIYLFRDPLGNRPLYVGKLNSNPIFASEDCVFKVLNVTDFQEVPPGSIVIIDFKGNIRFIPILVPRPAYCVFENIYFARPDSCIFHLKESVFSFRYHLGKRLAQEFPTPSSQFVTGIPDSGIPAAIGFHVASGLPFRILFIRNPAEFKRAFIEEAESRAEIVRRKLSILKELIKAYPSFTLVDDSIVRATTMRQIIKMLRELGAKEIHLRISAPPLISPCFMGIAFPTKKELIAANFSIKEIREFLQVDSLAYQTLRGVYETIAHLGGNPNHFCYACFTGKYPLPVKLL